MASEEADRPVPGSALGLKEQYPVRGKRGVCVCVGGGERQEKAVGGQ